MSGARQRTRGHAGHAVTSAAAAEVRGCVPGAEPREESSAVVTLPRTVDPESVRQADAAGATGQDSRTGLVTLRAGDAERTIRWGEPWHLGSASYWVQRCREVVGPHVRHALGETLAEEVAACILGGHGIPADVGLAAYRGLRAQGAFAETAAPTGAELEAALRVPLQLGGRSVRYRFAAQRGHRLARALAVLRASQPPSDALELRSWLMALPGVGPKTASWVVRNYLGSDAVAIIDVHVLRAGVIAGVFDPDWSPSRDYLLLEELFLSWAHQGQVSAAALDAIVWADMARFGRDVHARLGVPQEGWSWYVV